TINMFKEANYDTPDFSIAPNGMNQFISPDVLPPNFCYLLENILPTPLGEGNVRYGTDLINTLPNTEFPNPEFSIVKAFPFIQNGSIKQALLYIGYYKQDLSADNIIHCS
ncbi:MAG: hypothetical protein K0R49_1574, partial [Burkholderiales bacterium]|nr:hypothetical protein [Burkholderiales bacterium]